MLQVLMSSKVKAGGLFYSSYYKLNAVSDSFYCFKSKPSSNYDDAKDEEELSLNGYEQ